jgi:pseudouridine synthase
MGYRPRHFLRGTRHFERHMPQRRPNNRKGPPSKGKTSRPFRAPGKRSKAPRKDNATGPEGAEHTGERLQKILAQAGIASRRECEELIREGRVEVDRQVVTELGTRVDPLTQEIRVDGEALPRTKLVYFAVNKPIGVVSTSRDPAGRPRVIDLLPPNTPRVFAVGRLDLATEGLMLVTNDGELANGLTHPRHGVEKIYHVQVAGKMEPDVLAQLKRGIHLAEGFAHVKHARIKSSRTRSTLLEMILDEGRNREVRRLLARVGHKVQKLKRIAVGPVRLADLPLGAVRPLTPKEVAALQEAVAKGSTTNTGESKPRPPRPANSKGRKNHRGHEGHGGMRTVIGG